MVWTRDKSALALVAQEQESSFQQGSGMCRIREVRPAGSETISIVLRHELTANDSKWSRSRANESNIYVAEPAIGPTRSNHTRQRPLLRYFVDPRQPYPIRVRCTRVAGGHLDDESGRNRRAATHIGRRTELCTGIVFRWKSDRVSFQPKRQLAYLADDSEGGNPRQLSVSVRDGNWPQFTKDGKFVSFISRIPKAHSTSGKPPPTVEPAARLTNAAVMHPAISPIDDKIAAWYSAYH